MEYDINPKDVRKIIRWCEDIKAKEKKLFLVKRNPFKEEIPWTRNIISIEIDRPLNLASKSNLVYDSVSKKLFRYVNGVWVCLNDMKRL